MTELSNGRKAGVAWLIGVVLAVSLAVVVPIHLHHRFFPACGTAHASLRTTHHTVVDQLAGSLEARIDRTGRTPAPQSVTAAMAFVVATPGAPPRATSLPPQTRMFRHLRIAPAHADDGDPFSHIAFLGA